MARRKSNNWLPPTGRVLGIDVGYSDRRATTGLCVLSWNKREVWWVCSKARNEQKERRRALMSLLGEGNDPLLAVALDGPLRPKFKKKEVYRACESLLSCGPFQKRGKPGPCSSPAGQKLHCEATALAKLVLRNFEVEKANWCLSIHEKALAEAFPNQFLAVMCDEASVSEKPERKRRWTDFLFPLVWNKCECLIRESLPDRRIKGSFSIKDHEHIAAFVCALTALTAARGDAVFVGAKEDGWIVLPPRCYWGYDINGEEAWATLALEQNLKKVQRRFSQACVVDIGRNRA